MSLFFFIKIFLFPPNISENLRVEIAIPIYLLVFIFQLTIFNYPNTFESGINHLALPGHFFRGRGSTFSPWKNNLGFSIFLIISNKGLL
jgi:hypothetical protein